jgi:hypothetical protein
MRITSIELIDDKDIPPEARAKLMLPPSPPKVRKEPNVDFYEFWRAIERKQSAARAKIKPRE